MHVHACVVYVCVCVCVCVCECSSLMVHGGDYVSLCVLLNCACTSISYHGKVVHLIVGVVILNCHVLYTA